MNTVILDRIQPLDGLPPSLRGNALAYYDLRNMQSVFLPLTNLVTNGNFANTTGWTEEASALTASSNTGIITASGAASFGGIYRDLGIKPSGKIVNRTVKARVTNANCTSITVFLRDGTAGTIIASVSKSNPTANQWYTVELSSQALVPALTNNLHLYIRNTYADAATANGKVMEVQYVAAHDLSGDFGSGNEPTAAEMDAMLANYSATSWFDGTANVCINPAGRYYLPDTSGNGQHLHILNMAYSAASGPQVTSPPPYLKCDGTDDYGRRKLTAAIASGGAVSLSCWFRTSDVTAERRILRVTDMGGKFFAQYLTGSNFTSIAYDTAGGSKSVAKSLAGNNNIWNCLTSVYNPTTRVVSVWLNGAGKVDSEALAEDSAAFTNVLISTTDAIAAWYSGDYGDLAIFNKTLTAEDVKLLYNRRAVAYGRNRI